MMNKLFLILSTALFLFACSGGDDSPSPAPTPTPTPTKSLMVETQSIINGSEVDAATTNVIYIRYNAEVAVMSGASITLNNSQLMARVDDTDKQTVAISLGLSDDKEYTLKLAAGAVVLATDAKVQAPELIITFKTKKKDTQPEPSTNIPSEPVTASTDAAKKLYKYLYDQYGKKTISSVMANVNWNNDCAEKIHTLTGKYPAMNCYDFIHICYSPANWIDYTSITPVQSWVNKGGLVQLMWHFNVPKSSTSGISELTCTPSETTFRAKNVFTSGSWENKWFYEQMDKVVATLLKLQDAGIAATWRPFHEAAGNATYKQQAAWTTSWFWWGYDGPEIYKKLWRTMFDYFKQKGVNNLIWTWTTQNYNGNSSQYNNDASWYPGDEYVDIVGRDLYGYSAAKEKQEFTEIQARYPNKMIHLAECGLDGNTGTMPAQPGAAWTAGAKWGVFMVWYLQNTGSTDTMCNDNWWNTAMKNSYVITRDQVPSLK